jgi:hypothetical protein
MAEDILDAYHRLLEAQAVPFEAIAVPQDWHVSVFVVPSFQPEAIYDIDHRAGRTLFYRSRFTSSLWEAVFEARQQRGKVQPITIERACAELPPDNALVLLVSEEHLFRMEDRKVLGCGGITHTLVHAYHGGTRRIEAWEAQDVPQWARLLGAIGEAEALLPKR